MAIFNCTEVEVQVVHAFYFFIFLLGGNRKNAATGQPICARDHDEHALRTCASQDAQGYSLMKAWLSHLF